ncbi:MAG: PEP-CTERM sorting domain-containing protein [Pirellulales bacterium]|nr:PEP-CTERM sorting domain-containing protein [Pirellulales bacterium]
MMRYTPLVLATVLVAALSVTASAEVLFSDDFEAHTVGNHILQLGNGWAVEPAGFPGGDEKPSIKESGGNQYADMNDLMAGSGDTKIKHDAGLNGALDNTKKYTLRWTAIATTDVPFGNAADNSPNMRDWAGPVIGFQAGGTRPSVQLNGTGFTYNSLVDRNWSDTQKAVAFTNGQELDVELWLDGPNSQEGFRVTDRATGAQLAEHIVNHGNIASQMDQRKGIFVYFNSMHPSKNGSKANGYFDNVVVHTGEYNPIPEPTSLALLALSGLALVVRRRR